MPRLPRWTANEAETALLAAGFALLRSKGSHRIYGKGAFRVTVPFHSGAVLHPKIVKQVLQIIEEAGQNSATEE
jgi:predicted RNA binding protein YcfA (HicA-like mRNA interferase family)